MRAWNVVVTLKGRAFNRSIQLLRAYGEVDTTKYFNLLLMDVEDPLAFLEALQARIERDPRLAESVGHATPAFETFGFGSPEEFEEKARAIVRRLAPDLAGHSFYVRLRRRGFKGQLLSHVEERLLADTLLEAMVEQGAAGSVSFDDPDVVVLVETVDRQAGISVWTRNQRRRYPTLGLQGKQQAQPSYTSEGAAEGPTQVI